jgi:hypothetical protein
MSKVTRKADAELTGDDDSKRQKKPKRAAKEYSKEEYETLKDDQLAKIKVLNDEFVVVPYYTGDEVYDRTKPVGTPRPKHETSLINARNSMSREEIDGVLDTFESEMEGCMVHKLRLLVQWCVGPTFQGLSQTVDLIMLYACSFDMITGDVDLDMIRKADETSLVNIVESRYFHVALSRELHPDDASLDRTRFEFKLVAENTLIQPAHFIRTRRDFTGMVRMGFRVDIPSLESQDRSCDRSGTEYYNDDGKSTCVRCVDVSMGLLDLKLDSTVFDDCEDQSWSPFRKYLKPLVVDRATGMIRHIYSHELSVDSQAQFEYTLLKLQLMFRSQ